MEILKGFANAVKKEFLTEEKLVFNFETMDEIEDTMLFTPHESNEHLGFFAKNSAEASIEYALFDSTISYANELLNEYPILEEMKVMDSDIAYRIFAKRLVQDIYKDVIKKLFEYDLISEFAYSQLINGNLVNL